MKLPGDTARMRERIGEGAVAVVAVLLAGSLLFLLGNSHEPARYGPSIASWLVYQWTRPGSTSSHGWLVPLISLFVVWRRRRQLAAAGGQVDFRALLFIVPCLFLYWAGVRCQQPRLGVICLIGLCWAVPYYLFGSGVARLLVFPCSFLLFAVPLGFLSGLTFPLRLFSCSLSVTLLNGLGIEAFRQGTAILSAGANGFALDVADPCSGLHSLIAMTTLTAAYAALTQRGLWRKWVLFLSAVPLAITGNTVRIITISVVARVAGQELAMKVYHDFSGYIVFATAVVLMVLLGALLKLNSPGDT